MKRFKGLLWDIVSIALVFIIVAGCGENEEPADSPLSFKITSSSFNLNSTNINLNVPFAGATYKLSVDASPEVTWSATVESGDFIELTPVGEQRGDGEINIIAPANPNKENKGKVVVSIKNSIDNIAVKISFEYKEKELYFPEGTEGQTTADFYKHTSKYNTRYMKEGDNVAILWERTLTLIPTTAPRPFDPDKLLAVAEEVYAFMINDLKFASTPNSYADKYKFLVFVRDDDNGTAYGGGSKNVSMLWVSPGHLKDKDSKVIYHEMCHSFQYMAEFDGGADFRGVGAFYEMTSQWSLLQRYPNWIDLENSHFTAFMNLTYLALGHEDNQYHSPYVLEYWANKHGVDIISKMWQGAIKADGADFVKTYQRMTGTNQETFNDEIYDAATHFITWDLPHIEKAYRKGANIHTCKLQRFGGSYRITSERCPQDYGYNGIKLTVPAAGTKVSVNFKGLTNIAGFNIQRVDKAGWRYGFLAMQADGKRVYGDMGKEKNGTVTFTVPENTIHLWLVVAATPTAHVTHVNDNDPNSNATNEQWPYEITLKGTTPDGVKCEVVE